MTFESTALPQELTDAISAFDAAYTVSDAAGVAPFAADEFEILVMHPEHRVTPREEWLAGFGEYRLLEWDVHDEAVSAWGSSAIHHRKAFRRASSWMGELSGEICVTDSWHRHHEHGWQVWQRFVTPVSE